MPRRLRLDRDGAGERDAERAVRGWRTREPEPAPRRGVGAHGDGGPAPADVLTALGTPGRPLEPGVRAGAERRWGADLGQVSVHTGAAAQRAASSIDAYAYTVGRSVVLGADNQPGSGPDREHVLAHELAHVVQGGAEGVVHRYRRSGAMASGERDMSYMEPRVDVTGVVPVVTLTRRDLVEDSFDMRTDKETKPWIAQVDVVFDGTSTDSDGNVFATGRATAAYYRNAVAWNDFSVGVSGGSGRMGTDAGSFTVHRIEGYGYNSGSASGTPGVDFQWSDREPRRKGALDHRYTRKDPVTGARRANMSFAVFYNRGEALHAGPLDYTSHGCVHVDWATVDTGWSAMQQLNYHSVIGATKVKVSYV